MRRFPGFVKHVQGDLKGFNFNIVDYTINLVKANAKINPKCFASNRMRVFVHYEFTWQP